MNGGLGSPEPDRGLAALVLAGGGSTRLGEPKQLLDWGGRPLLQHVVDVVSEWPVGTVAVVLGAHADAILERIDFGDATVVLNLEWEEGLASSLRVGLDALARDPRLDAALIALADQPMLEPTVVPRLVEAYRGARAKAVVPKYRYTRGNPVLVDRVLWPRLMSLSGDAGARGLLQAHPQWVHEVQFDVLPPRDVDTQADFEELRPRR